MWETKMRIPDKDLRMLASWARVFLAGVLTVAATGDLSPRNLVTAGVIAVVPVVLRWLNPNDTAYGRSS
jgi:hypothetical protein